MSGELDQVRRQIEEKKAQQEKIGAQIEESKALVGKREEELRRVRNEVLEERIVYEDEHVSQVARTKRVQKRNTELTQMMQEGIFGDKKVLIPSGAAPYRAELSEGPKNARDKLRRKSWAANLNAQIQKEDDAFALRSAHKALFDKNYQRATQRMEERLRESEEIMPTDFANLMTEAFETNGFWQKFGEDEMTMERPAEDLAALSASLLQDLFAAKEHMDSEHVAPLLERYRASHKDAEGDFSVEYLVRDKLVSPEATWCFLMSATVEELGKQINDQKGADRNYSEGDIANLEALLVNARAISDRLYVSQRYKQLVISAKKGAAEENAAIMKEVDGDARVLEKKAEKEAEQSKLDDLYDARKANDSELDALARKEQILLEKQKEMEQKEAEKKRRAEQEKKEKESEALMEKTVEVLKKSEKALQAFYEKNVQKPKKKDKQGSWEFHRNAFVHYVVDIFTKGFGDGEIPKTIDFDEKILGVLYKQYAQMCAKNIAESEINLERIADFENESQDIRDRIETGKKNAERRLDEALDLEVRTSLLKGISPLLADLTDAPSPSMWQQYGLTVDKYMDANGLSEEGCLRSFLLDVLAKEPVLNEKGQEEERDKRFRDVLSKRDAVRELLLKSGIPDEREVAENVTYLLCSKRTISVEKALSDYAENKELFEEFQKMEPVCQDPLLSALYKESERTLAFKRFTLSAKAFANLYDRRREYLVHHINAAAVIEEALEEVNAALLDGGEMQITKEDGLLARANLLDMYEADIRADENLSHLKPIFISYLSERMSRMALLQSGKGMLGVGTSVFDTFEARKRGTVSSTEFRQFLKDHGSKAQQASVEKYSANELGIFAMVLALPEMLSWTVKDPGIDIIGLSDDTTERLYTAQRILADFKDRRKVNVFDTVSPDFQGAELVLTKTGKKGQTVLDEEKFAYAAGFVKLCTHMQQNVEKMAAERAKISAKLTEEDRKNLETLREAVTPEQIRKSKNAKAIELLKTYAGGMRSEADLLTTLWLQAESEGQRKILLGFEALSEEQKKLALFALAKRDVLDISKKNINLNRMGKAERDYANPEGRDELADCYVKGVWEQEFKPKDYDNAFLGLLSSQVDDRNYKDISHRSTAIDWKLLRRSVQFAYRCENEKHLFASQKKIFNQDKLRAAGLDLEKDPRALRKNLHNSGTRFTRFAIRKSLDSLKDDVPDIAKEAVSFIFSEDGIQSAHLALEAAKKTKFGGFADNAVEVGGTVKDAIEVVQGVVTIVKSSVQIHEGKKAKKEAEKEIAEQIENQKYSHDEATSERRENEKNLFIGLRFSEERAGDEIQDALVSCANFVYGLALPEEKLGPKLIEAAGEMIKFMRSYFTEVSSLKKFFDVDAESARINELAERHHEYAKKKPIGEHAVTAQKLSVISAVKGFENMTEISEMVGRNVCQSILFTASRFFNGQPNVMALAEKILASVGHMELKNDLSAEAAGVLFTAIMGEYR